MNHVNVFIFELDETKNIVEDKYKLNKQLLVEWH